MLLTLPCLETGTEGIPSDVLHALADSRALTLLSFVVAAQIAFGSGFKCNSAVFRAMRTIHDPDHLAWQHISSGKREAII